jgi:uncharacterized protein YaaQ
MGCASCGQRADAATTYPREVQIGGETVLVTSAADERTQRAKFQAAERAKHRLSGYTVTRR